jgi:hypothetical protein
VTDLEATQKALADAVDVAIWLSGLPCLNPESEAWPYWESGARPKLYKAMTLLDAPVDEPPTEPPPADPNLVRWAYKGKPPTGEVLNPPPNYSSQDQGWTRDEPPTEQIPGAGQDGC